MDMGARGPKPRRRKPIEWSANLAYAIGLLVTDGSLSKDGRHIVLVSKDIEQLQTFKRILGLKNSIGETHSGYTGKPTTRVQFGDVRLYEFLLLIGLMPNKTKVIGKVRVPDKYFFDFLRGHFDGDGSSYSYLDPRWRSSFMFYVSFLSASEKHISWLRSTLQRLLGVQGHISKNDLHCAMALRFAKHEAIKVVKAMYQNSGPCLSRKRLKIRKTLRIIGQSRNSVMTARLNRLPR